MAFCGEASTWAKVALLLHIVALGSHATGYGTNHWMARSTGRYKINFSIGLWRMTDCSGYFNAPCTDSAMPDSYYNIKVGVTRFVETVALIQMLGTTINLLVYVTCTCARTRVRAISTVISGFLAVAFTITGMVVWLVNLPEYHYVSWSFGLTVFGATLIISASILHIVDILEYAYKGPTTFGGGFVNLPVVEEEAPPPPPTKQMHKDDLDPIIVPQNPLAAPTFQYLQYDRSRQMDGF